MFMPPTPADAIECRDVMFRQSLLRASEFMPAKRRCCRQRARRRHARHVYVKEQIEACMCSVKVQGWCGPSTRRRHRGGNESRYSDCYASSKTPPRRLYRPRRRGTRSESACAEGAAVRGSVVARVMFRPRAASNRSAVVYAPGRRWLRARREATKKARALRHPCANRGARAAPECATHREMASLWRYVIHKTTPSRAFARH